MMMIILAVHRKLIFRFKVLFGIAIFGLHAIAGGDGRVPTRAKRGHAHHPEGVVWPPSIAPKGLCQKQENAKNYKNENPGLV